VVNTYRIWLRYELFRDRLNEPEFVASERTLTEFINARASSKQHLTIEMKVAMRSPALPSLAETGQPEGTA
jgi:3'-5' exonuclease